MPGFMFATGIENSYPAIDGGARVDQMEKCGHYLRWKEDLALVQSLGLHFLRWGPALYKTFVAPGKYDWDWVDDFTSEAERLKIDLILDLCHFGVPDWMGNFQNRDFPRYFAEYAGQFARRYPQFKHWTPVNEILITAMFSAKHGWWNEQLTSDEAFVRAMLNLCQANVMAMREILKYVPDAVFIQSESSEYTHPMSPKQLREAEFFNQRRFLPLDLTYSNPVSALVYRYLVEHGMTAQEYDYFMQVDVKFRCVLGTDYYVTNEHLLREDGTIGPAGEFFGYYVIAKQYYERYGLPLMHTETNIWEASGSVQWLWKEWNCLLRLRQDGVPIVGFTWYSLTDQMDWDSMLREDAHRVNSVGLFDLERKIRPVGKQYRRLIEQWREILPAGSSALMLV